ncbi:MAG: hypothetical protein FWF53_01275 [Candidatus Azobacteroides sp.]|nr:hypothetical protein [Candidatus Azobacteroides sp.]
MTTTGSITRKTDLENLIESGNKVAVLEMIETKEAALKDATDSVEYWASRNMADCEYSINEADRAKRLQKQISQLKAAL